MNPYARSCAIVAKNPRHVLINLKNLYDLAKKLAGETFRLPNWREEVFPESDENIIDFFGVANSINFCFTDFKTCKKYDVEYPEGSGKIWHGSFAMTAAIKRAIENGVNLLDPDILKSLIFKDIQHIFRHVSTPIPMPNDRLKNLRNIGNVLKTYYGSFKKLFEACNYKLFNGGNGIVESLTGNFQAYRDVSTYRSLDTFGFTQKHFGQEIIFAKRAQLFPMVYHGRALSSGGRLQPIRDSVNFGPIADYQIAKVLRAENVLEYSKELSIMINLNVPINRDSDYEVEIRAQENNAMINILTAVNKFRAEVGKPSITMLELDYAIWSLGRKPAYKNLPHHYTYTTAY